MHRHTTAGTVVFNGVVAEIEQHLFEDRPHGGQCRRFAFECEGYSCLVGSVMQPVKHRAHKLLQLPRFADVRKLPFVKLGNFNHIADQRNQSLRFVKNTPREFFHIRALHHAVPQDFREAGDGGQRCFQFMGDVGRELPPQSFPLQLFGDIHEQQHRARGFAVVPDRVGGHLTGHFPEGQHGRFVTAVERGFHRAAEWFAAIECQDVFGGLHILYLQQPQRARVDRQQRTVLVDDQQPFLHIGGDLGKSGLLPFGLGQLHGDGFLLFVDLGQQRSNLLVTFPFFGMLKIQLIDRLHDLFGCPEGEEAGQRQQQKDDKGQRLQQSDKQDRHVVLGAGYPQHRAVIQPEGVINGLLREGVRLSHRLAGAGFERFLDLSSARLSYRTVPSAATIVMRSGRPDSFSSAAAPSPSTATAR